MSIPANEQNFSKAEDARIGYQVAVDLATFYVEAFWSIFNAMLVANSIVVAGISFVLTNQPPLAVFRVLLPIVGLVLCITWWLLGKRAQERATYCILSARELEERYLGPQVRTISRGGDLADGRAVSLEIGGSQTTRRLSLWARLLRGEWTSYIVILVFVAVYVSIFFQI